MRISRRDLGRALRRLRADQRDDWLPDPVGFSDVDLEDPTIRDVITDSMSDPDLTEDFDLPKPRFTLRSGTALSWSDRVAYQALADKAHVLLDDSLSASVYSFRRNRGERSQYMYRKPIEAWLEYRRSTRDEAISDSACVLSTDVQNYFESIQHSILFDELRQNVPEGGRRFDEALRHMECMLAGWNRNRLRLGIPQNCDPSSLLGNSFLTRLDRSMSTGNYRYRRFMDDITVVCADEFAARRALLDITRLLKLLGLTLNSRKTEILHVGTPEFDEAFPADDLETTAIATAVDSGNRLRQRAVVSPLLEMAERTVDTDDIDEREFKFSVGRLRMLSRAGFSIDWSSLESRASELLVERPWLTDYHIEILESSINPERHVDAVVAILECPDRGIYDWQLFHLWRFLASHGDSTLALRNLARTHSQLTERAPVAAAASLYLGSSGTQRDRSGLIERLRDEQRPFLRRAYVVALQEASDRQHARIRAAGLDGGEAKTLEWLRSEDRPPMYFAPRRNISPGDVPFEIPEIMS